MSFREMIAVDCDCCGETRIGPDGAPELFSSHSAALCALPLARWLVTGDVILCEYCHIYVLRWADQEGLGDSSWLW